MLILIIIILIILIVVGSYIGARNRDLNRNNTAEFGESLAGCATELLDFIWKGIVIVIVIAVVAVIAIIIFVF